VKIECIYVVCYRGDVRLVRTLVASIRRWYVNVPVVLIKDELAGTFSTREIERTWGATVLKTARVQYGWCWAKLEPLFLPGRQRCLILDADILFAGPVLGLLERQEEDIVVSREEVTDPRSDYMRRTYYDYDALLRLDSDFKFPGFTFNAGQILATTGILKREDFEGLVDWRGSIPKLVRPDIFACGDQGVMNYLLAKKAQRQEIKLGQCKYMIWPKSPDAANLESGRITRGEGYPLLIHWAGLQNPSFRKMPMGDLLLDFERQYYSRVTFAKTKRLSRYLRFRCWVRLRRLKQQVGLRK